MKVIAVTQARVGSTRLPGKILKKINGLSLLEIHLMRIIKSSSLERVIVATTYETGVDEIIKIAEKIGVVSFQGNTDDVLDRFYNAVKMHRPDYVVRLTSDCPLIDAALIDRVVKHAIAGKLDYCSNTIEETFPDGQDIEVFTFQSLEKAWSEATLKSDREHVTPFIRKHSNLGEGDMFIAGSYREEFNWGNIRMTVDEQEDFLLIERLVKELGITATMNEYVAYLQLNKLAETNKHIKRNEGYYKSLRNDNKL